MAGRFSAHGPDLVADDDDSRAGRANILLGAGIENPYLVMSSGRERMSDDVADQRHAARIRFVEEFHALDGLI